jgi:modulator of FtsH protease HflK
MDRLSGWRARATSLWNEGGPWGGRRGGGGSGGSGGGNGGGGDGSGGGKDGGPRNPWSQPPGGGGKPRGPRGSSAADQMSAKLRDMFGGNMPSGGNSANMIKYGLLAFVAIWLLFTSFHRIGPQEQGVITRFGKYAGKLDPGIGMTMPSPIDRVQKVDVSAIKTINIPEGSGENLILTGDQNIVDLAYSVRWGVRYPEYYLFQLAEPERTISEVAESAMREVMSSVTLADAFGPRRSQIEQQVAERMQGLLNDYKAGVTVRGVAIKQADPPAVVNDAFKSVTAAQQAKQANINNANTYAQQVLSRAQGEAAAFDKVYEQYRLAPGVTRRRMYYETMEAVLSNTDKTIVEPAGIAPYLPLSNGKPRVIVEEPSK